MRRFTYFMDWELLSKSVFQCAVIWMIVLIVHSIPLSTWLNVLLVYGIIEASIIVLVLAFIALTLLHYMWIDKKYPQHQQ